MKYLIDSVIIIDHLNAVWGATEFIDKHFTTIAISVVTRAEVLVGCGNVVLPKVKLLLDQFQTLSMMRGDADLAAEIRRKYKIKLPDAIQASIAQNHDLTLVTRNTKDFTSRRFKNILVPYKL